MKFHAFKIWAITSAYLLFLCCSAEKPTAIDGTVSAGFIVIDTSGTLAGISLSDLNGVPDARVRANCVEYDAPFDLETDGNGFFELDNVRAARYRISADKLISLETNLELNQRAIAVQLTGSIELDLSRTPDPSSRYVIYMRATTLSPIVMNEIYYSGPASSGIYYSDQFVELYNASDTTQYLDGLLLCRASTRLDYIGQYAEVFYVYQFPGNGTDNPIQPGQFIVVAQDALDHVAVGGAPGSIDLSHADWECYNQLGNDLDNPEVPNLLNVNANRPVDFMTALTHNGVILAKVADVNQFVYTTEGYILLNFAEVLDGVEYATSPDANKEMDSRLDTGLAGNGIQKYSGHSTERENPETGGPGYDTNNSTFDFVSLISPTPGYQHSQSDLLAPLKKK